MATIMEGDTIIVTRDLEKERGQVCITGETRERLGGPAHAWYRAARHCFTFKDCNYFLQLEAAKACFAMGEAFRNVTPRPPQRSKWSWGWGKGWPGVR